jgi:hypothetical protein
MTRMKALFDKVYKQEATNKEFALFEVLKEELEYDAMKVREYIEMQRKITNAR